MEAFARPFRNDLRHLASTCGNLVSVLIRNDSERPDCHWHHAVAMRTVLEIVVSVLQCFKKRETCPSLWSTHQGIIPHPANVFGVYRIAKGVCRLKPRLERIIEAVLVSAAVRCL